MSGVKHTPGSWTVEDKRSLNDAFWIEVQHPDGYSVSIAEVRDGCDEAAELGCMEANARLIAAAPDLLEAGQELQSARKAQKLAPSAENLSRVRAASDAFDAAISRATQSPATEGGESA